jgi:DNA-binding HxlR family transcriptional regulator
MDVTEIAPNHLEERRDARSCLKITQVLSRIGDKWTVLIIILLRERGYRFNELKRGIDGISQRMLTLTLRNMERVDYELTDIGRSLAGPVKILGDWAFEHLGRIAAAQAMFDARTPEI